MVRDLYKSLHKIPGQVNHRDRNRVIVSKSWDRIEMAGEGHIVDLDNDRNVLEQTTVIVE